MGLFSGLFGKWSTKTTHDCDTVTLTGCKLDWRCHNVPLAAARYRSDLCFFPIVARV